MAYLNRDAWEKISDEELRHCKLGDIVAIACLVKGTREVKETLTGELVGYKLARNIEDLELNCNVAEITIDLLERAGGRAVLPGGAIDDSRYDWYFRVIG